MMIVGCAVTSQFQLRKIYPYVFQLTPTFLNCYSVAALNFQIVFYIKFYIEQSKFYFSLGKLKKKLQVSKSLILSIS